jgi:di/tripeptidase
MPPQDSLGARWTWDRQTRGSNHLDSPALAVSGRVCERLFGQAPIITAVHAWLETAVIGDRVPGLDMVSGVQRARQHVRARLLGYSD